MDIACPNCAATYRVPEALLAQGKPLRCAACGETWVPEIPPAPPAEDAPPTGPPTEPPTQPSLAESPSPEPVPGEVADEAPAAASPVPEPAADPPPRPAPPLSPPPLHPPVLQRRPAVGRSVLALRLAWAASLVTVLLALAGLVLYADAIAAAWPPFARVTALLGV